MTDARGAIDEGRCGQVGGGGPVVEQVAAVNLKTKLARFSDHWSPRVIAEMNDYQFKLVKIKGEFV